MAPVEFNPYMLLIIVAVSALFGLISLFNSEMPLALFCLYVGVRCNYLFLRWLVRDESD